MVNERLATRLNENETVFIIDSMPIPVCKNARDRRLKICRENYETAPDKGYSAVNKQYFTGYKLHLVISMKGVFSNMDLSKASVHDLKYLSDVKSSGLNNCVLLGDQGYISAAWQLDLFSSARIELQTPPKSNQQKSYPYIFKRQRKRIETLFSQLCDQMMIKRNYAKTFAGLCTRTISKITAVTVLQFINFLNQRPINQIKHALAK